MGFFDTLKRVLGTEQGAVERRVADAWGLDVEGEATDRPNETGQYDRAQWQKKLRRILEELPGSQTEWDGLKTEARALQLDPNWVAKCQYDEFLFLIRRAVSDGVFSEHEHRKLDLARDLIGLSEVDAEAALHSIVSEAETFFGKSVDGA